MCILSNIVVFFLKQHIYIYIYRERERERERNLAQEVHRPPLQEAKLAQTETPKALGTTH